MLMKKSMTLQKTQKVGSFFPLRLIGLLPRNPGEATINQSMSSKSLVSKSLSNVTPTQTRSAQLLKSIPNPTQTCRHWSESALTLVWSCGNRCQNYYDFCHIKFLVFQKCSWDANLNSPSTGSRSSSALIIFISAHPWVLIFSYHHICSNPDPFHAQTHTLQEQRVTMEFHRL